MAAAATARACGFGSVSCHASPTRWASRANRKCDFADIVVHHLPPGTSKWNKVEHRLFSFITMNWKAEPLVSYRVIVDLIAATTTKTGLTVRCELDSTHYTKGIVISKNEMDGLHITRDAFHGEWNYTIHPAHPTATNAPPVKAVIFG